MKRVLNPIKICDIETQEK